MDLILGFTDTCRKCGYVIWGRDHDDVVHRLFGDAREVTLVLPNGTRKTRAIDWARRRISVGYTVTRAAAVEAGTIRIHQVDAGTFLLSFQ